MKKIVMNYLKDLIAVGLMHLKVDLLVSWMLKHTAEVAVEHCQLMYKSADSFASEADCNFVSDIADYDLCSFVGDFADYSAEVLADLPHNMHEDMESKTGSNV